MDPNIPFSVNITSQTSIEIALQFRVIESLKNFDVPPSYVEMAVSTALLGDSTARTRELKMPRLRPVRPKLDPLGRAVTRSTAYKTPWV